MVIFTKYDALELKCYSKLREQGKSHEEASIQMPKFANKILQDEYLPRVLGAKFPPKTYVCLTGNVLYSYLLFKFSQILGLDEERNQCPELSKKTMEILDNDALVNLFISTQKNNLDICIQEGIKLVIFLVKNLFAFKKSIEASGSMVIFFITFEQRALIKYNIEPIEQKHIIFDLLTWFPHYWVRKLIIVKKK